MSDFKKIDFNGDILPIRQFKLEWMNENPSICMIAKRRSGKSWVCRHILSKYTHIPGGVIICATERLNAFYGKFFPQLYIHYEFQTELIEKILFRQKIMIRKAIDYYKKKKKCDPRFILVMDDCLSSKGEWMKDKTILEIFFNGRHYQIMYIFTMQYAVGIKPELRTNFDYIFLLAEDFECNLKKLHIHFAGMFPNFNTFKQAFTEITRDYGSMVISNCGARSEFLDKVFWYKAENVNFDKVGSKQFNKFNDKNYNPLWEDREMENNSKVDVGKLMENRKGRINVQLQ